MPSATPPPRPGPAALTAAITQLHRGFGGKVGIAVESVDEHWRVTAGGGQLLPQQSVSKLWVTMTVLDAKDAGRLALTDPVTVTRQDLTLFHQPIAGLIKNGEYHATIGELIQRAMTMSDNTANDKLLRIVGGPAAVRSFLTRHGIGGVRFGPGEKLLQSTTAGLEWKPQYSLGNAFARARAALPASVRMNAFERYVANPIDGAEPDAIASALVRLKRGELLAPDSTAYLLTTMESARTGRARIHGAVPPGWRYGHKTGTGQDLRTYTAGFNDVGLLTAPDGRTYAVAVMIGETDKPVRDRQALMQAVAQAIVASHDRGASGA